MSKTKVLIIENQYSQFKIIADFIERKSQYEVYPSREAYRKFMDCVQVFVNVQYKEYREMAFEKLKGFIEGRDVFKENIEIERPDMILMDHILGGAHHCLTGIDLASYINGIFENITDTPIPKKNKKELIPVLFLSRTAHNDEIRLIGEGQNGRIGYKSYKDNFGHCEWIHKGFFGNDKLNEEYFRDYVLPEIKKLLGGSQDTKFRRMVEAILGLSYTKGNKEEEGAKQKLENIKMINYKDLPQEKIQIVTELYEMIGMPTQSRIPTMLIEKVKLW